MSLRRKPPQSAASSTFPRRDMVGNEKLAPGNALVIGLLMASAFIVLLNEMLLGVALPTLIADLEITPATAQWLTTAYLLTLAVLVPATGFVMLRFHLRTIFFAAMTLFTVGTMICALAPGFGVLLTGRIVQAVGTAVFVPLLMTTTLRLVPAGRRGRMMAMATAVPAIAPAVGPAVSGLVLAQLSWRWLFLLVLPLAVLELALGAAKLRNITTPEPLTLDVLSLVLSALGFGALVYGLAAVGESVSGHAPVPLIIPFVVGLAGVAAFVHRQVMTRRHGNPLLDMRIFRIQTFNVSLAVMVVVALLGFGVTLVLPLVLANVVELNTLQIGLFLVPGGAMIALVSALGGRVYDRFGPRPLTIPGAIIWSTTLWFFSTVDTNTSIWTLLIAYLILTGSQAMMWPTLTTNGLNSLRDDLYPHGTAAFTTVQQLAGAAGGAVLISAYTIGADADNAGALTIEQSTSAAQATFLTAAVISLAAVLSTPFVRRAAPRPPVDATPSRASPGGARVGT